MIIQADVKGLEIVTAAYLSQDEVMMQELWDKVDIHEENRKRFDLPTRLIAKTYLFRLIYGGSAWSYALDPEFSGISKKPEFWQSIIDESYSKYGGLSDWHKYIIHEATTTGRVVCPTGRFFEFKPYSKNGDWKWPVTTIKNYPVQGTGADLVSLARIEFFRRFTDECVRGKLISSVHDSLVCDVHSDEVDHTATLLRESVEKVPQLFKERFGVSFNLPLTVEIGYGLNHKDLLDI